MICCVTYKDLVVFKNFRESHFCAVSTSFNSLHLDRKGKYSLHYKKKIDERNEFDCSRKIFLGFSLLATRSTPSFQPCISPPALLFCSQPELDTFFQTNSVEYLALIFEDSKSYIGREVTCWSVSWDVAFLRGSSQWGVRLGPFNFAACHSDSPLLPAATF